MKRFEENLNAWLEGRLNEKELAAFEAALPQISAADLETQDALKLGAFLKEQIGERTMANGDFFQHRLLEQIKSGMPSTERPEFAQPRPNWWSIGRLAWTGATSLAIFAVCTFFVLRQEPSVGPSGYTTQIINWRIDPVVSPDATISMFELKEDKVTVLWVDGLQSLPSEYASR